MKFKTPEKWDELLNAGYVVELDECQIAEAKSRFNMIEEKPFKYKTPEEAMADSNDREAKLRGLK